MQIAFTKMQGTGNRIVVVDERESDRAPPAAASLQRLADRRHGPGFDQLMWLGPAAGSNAVARYRVFNADGSEVEQCGNGVRCVALLLGREAGIETLQLDSPAGPITARIVAAGRVAVDMGKPEFRPERIPFVADRPATRYEIDVNGRNLPVSVVSMGNPHCVLEVDAVAAAPVSELGPLLERHNRFPSRSNVGFMALRDRAELDLRVYERGVGETLACGTGACAAVVAARRLDHVDDDVRVNLPGGQLVVSWRGGDADPVWLTGDAEHISEGTLDI